MGSETRDKQKPLLPAASCKRFARCAVNRCPLHPSYLELRNHPDDPGSKCRAPKSHRAEIGKRYPGVLPYDGLTGNEYSAANRPTPKAFEQHKGRGFATGANPVKPAWENEPTFAGRG